MNKNIVIMADESFYYTWIHLGLDISEIEQKVEKEIGHVTATDIIANKMIERIPKIRSLSSKSIILWKTKVTVDNDRYHKLIKRYSACIDTTYTFIVNDAKNLLRLLHAFDKGASFDDVDILANARWIGLNTPFAPLIVTEDRDLLGFGHMISSYLGLPIAFLSVFEVLRLANIQHAMLAYFEYYNLPLKTTIQIGEQISAKKFEAEISNLVRKAKIAFHPTLRKHDSIRRITRQARH